MTNSSPPELLLPDYWTSARQPWTSLVFVLPFLVIYEVGVLLPSVTEGARNGADVWLRETLLAAGWTTHWQYPLLVPVILLSWQAWKRLPWKCSYETLAGMLGESLLFALMLVGMGRLLHSAVAVQVADPVMPSALSFLGAGIYEELLFRLILLPVIYGVIRLAQAPVPLAAAGAILISSLLFATAHYVSTPGLLSPDELINALTMVANQRAEWYGFAFRCLAGLLFASLFWFRGFGIAAGTHLLYDLIVGTVLTRMGT